MVQQNDFLMADTIDENIRFGRRMEEAAIRDAAASAQAEFITRKEEGFQTKLTARGANLSGGQKQRVLIAVRWRGIPVFCCWMTAPLRWTTRRTRCFGCAEGTARAWRLRSRGAA